MKERQKRGRREKKEKKRREKKKERREKEEENKARVRKVGNKFAEEGEGKETCTNIRKMQEQSLIQSNNILLCFFFLVNNQCVLHMISNVDGDTACCEIEREREKSA